MNITNWPMQADGTDLRVRNFINGDYTNIDLAGEPAINKYSPRDGRLLYQFGVGSKEEVYEAVSYARQAFNDGRWRNLSLVQRKNILRNLADLIEVHQEELALYESLDVGKPISKALLDDIPRTSSILRANVESADKLLSPSGSDGAVFGYQLRKPAGVVAAIIGWNYPLALAVTKAAPALIMGNSLVLKPSEFSSLSASRLAELAVEAGVPPGVFNIVHGVGNTVGAALAHHPDVDILSFTGSSVTGKQMMISAGESNMKKVMLECGGKSPYLVFDDCPNDLDAIAADIVAKAFPNQGALCVAGTRLLIQESLKEKLLSKVLEQTAKIIPEDPLSQGTTFGAIINEAHLNKILAYIESGKREGARLVYGGKRVYPKLRDGNSNKGYYIGPTIFDQVNPQQKIAQEEIFGPVLSVFTFKSEEDAINLANNSCFGLAAYAATTSLGRAQRLAQQINVGQLIITETSTPSGGDVSLSTEGHKQSGIGFEHGLAGLASYTVSTAVYMLT